jgi:RimJ/RimL family protein N-acetyltransferase
MLTIRELSTSDIPHLVHYWMSATPEYLLGMGADQQKLPNPEDMETSLHQLLKMPLEKRPSYCLIWLQDGQPIGHTNTNPTYFGKEGFMHLHLWESPARQQGLGTSLLQKSIPWFFENLKLQKLYCQPYALNPAPNRTLLKVGFEFVKEYTTVPGSINFEQPVMLWKMTKDRYNQLYAI